MRLGRGTNFGCFRTPSDVRPVHMKWSRDKDAQENQGEAGRRGYHHGNLRGALIKAALDLITSNGPPGFTFAGASRAAWVSPAAPYRHFGCRDRLMADLA